MGGGQFIHGAYADSSACHAAVQLPLLPPPHLPDGDISDVESIVSSEDFVEDRVCCVCRKLAEITCDGCKTMPLCSWCYTDHDANGKCPDCRDPEVIQTDAGMTRMGIDEFLESLRAGSSSGTV